jgi:FkbM family methyltransferase
MSRLKESAKRLLGDAGLFNVAQSIYQHVTPDGRRWGKEIKRLENSAAGLYGQFVSPGDLAFDIGANFGFRTAAFLKLGARVVSVEPQDIAMNNLRLRFERNKRVTLVQAGAGEAIGEHEFFMGQQHVASSMSTEWIARMKERPEYKEHEWNRKAIVKVTTLDELIASYGLPDFIKIDVEGFEYNVLKGLSQSVAALSLEYNKEFLEPAIQSVERLATLGDYEFNYSLAESMQLALSGWIAKDALLAKLPGIAAESVSGDVYARLRK